MNIASGARQFGYFAVLGNKAAGSKPAGARPAGDTIEWYRFFTSLTLSLIHI